jgi:hypothetical protein
VPRREQSEKKHNRCESKNRSGDGDQSEQQVVHRPASSHLRRASAVELPRSPGVRATVCAVSEVRPVDPAGLAALCGELILYPPASLNAVHEAEHRLLQLPDSEPGWYDLSEALALYSPGGGDHLLDAAGLRSAAVGVLHDLDDHQFCQH